VKVFVLPSTIRALVFDVDGTLYEHREYMAAQERQLVERLARHRQVPLDEAAALIETTRAQLAASGKRPSFGAVLLALGIAFEESARWRDELFQPECYLKRDGALSAALERLAARYLLAAVSNNATGIVRRTLECVGIERHFRFAAGIERAGAFKPAPRIFEIALEALGVPATEAVSIGVRYDVDIAGALTLGMGGVLIERYDDLLELPQWL
jgi:phosphoglycolate phosphatase/putative hydrolase of the HAD superfamily